MSAILSRPHCVKTVLKSQDLYRLIERKSDEMTVISDMMTSSNGNIFRVTVPLCGEFTGNRWITLTKASDAGLWCYLLSAPEHPVM